MGREINKLTAKQAQQLTQPGRFSDGGGLYLVVSGEGRRRWLMRYTIAGKLREMGLGAVRDVTLAEARRKAEAARQQVRDGVDPLAVKAAPAARATPTFAEEAKALQAAMGPSWRNEKHKAQWKMTLEVHAADLANKPVDEVKTEDVLAVLTPLWHSVPETASRLRGRIEAVLAAATVKGHRSGPNPAQWRNHLDHLLPKPKKLTRGHHAALPYQEVPQVVGRLRAVGGISASALEFLILTATRSGEVLGARWDELDLLQGLWTIPPDRMKGGREHRVPLPARALAILGAMKTVRHEDHPFVFPGQKHRSSLSAMALEMVLRRLDISATPHGFRSSFRDWAGDRTAFQREVVEAALAHLVGDETERAYRRSDALEKRTELMKAWADFCEPALT